MSIVKRKKECLCVYAIFVAIFKPMFIPTLFQQIIKLFLIIIVFTFLISKTKIKELVNISLLFGIAVVVSSFFAKKMNYISTTSFFDSIYYALCIYCLHGVIAYFTKRNRSRECLVYFLDIITIYCILTFITLLFPLYIDTTGLTTYAFGNKFTSTYLLLLFLGVFYSLYNKPIKKKVEWRIIYFTFIVLSIIIARAIDCSTTIMAMMVFFVAYFLSDKIKNILMLPQVVFCTVAFTGSFPVLMAYIMNLKFVQYIVVNILGESLNINYRNIIYKSYLFQLIGKSPIFGYGYANTVMADKTNYAFGNAQNGLMDVALKYGIIGAIAIVITIVYCFKKSNRTSQTQGLALFVYSILVAGIIEVTYSWFLLLGLFFVLHIDEKIESMTVTERVAVETKKTRKKIRIRI